MRALARSTPRPLAVLVATLLLTLLAAPTMADAEMATVATEVHEQAPGPEPMDRHEEGNFGAPTEHAGPPFARFVAAVLTIAAVGGLVGLGYLYLLLVKRPQRRHSAGA